MTRATSTRTGGLTGWSRWLAALAALAMLAAACGGSSSEDGLDSDAVAATGEDTDVAGDGADGDGAAEDGGTIKVEGGTDDASTHAGSDDVAAGEEAADGDAAADEDAMAEADGDSDGDSDDGTGADGDGSGDGDSSTTSEQAATTEQTTTTEATTTTEQAETTRPATGGGSGPTSIDWWGCWQASDAQASGDGSRVSLLPNCATGPSSIGSAGDMSHPDAPIYRSGGANGNPSIRFTFDGDTLLQTNGGRPWTGGDVLPASGGVTLAWVGVVTDVNSHNVKYVVSGLSDGNEYPQLLVEGEGPNRFAGWAGGGAEARSADGTVRDGQMVGVIMYFSDSGGSSSIAVNGQARGGQDSTIRESVAGLTLGNFYGRNFSTTDHHFVFLGLRQGEMSDGEKAEFWNYVSGL